MIDFSFVKAGDYNNKSCVLTCRKKERAKGVSKEATLFFLIWKVFSNEVQSTG